MEDATEHSLDECFFVFDDEIGSETADPEQVPLFFYPPSLPVLDLAGYVSAMQVFAQVRARKNCRASLTVSAPQGLWRSRAGRRTVATQQAGCLERGRRHHGAGRP